MVKTVLRAALYSTLLYIGLFFYFFNSSSYSISSIKTKPTPKGQERYLPIIRLHDPAYGFVCSAVVISDSVALTAAHCVIENWAITPFPTLYSVWDSTYSKEVKGVVPVGFDKLRDVAILNGNFREFVKIKPDFSGKMQQDLKNTLVKTCGFPAGGELFCNPIVYVSNWFFQMKFTGGQLYKGMSGGPVMVQDTLGNWWVIGVNSAVFFDSILIGPIIGIDGYLL